MLRPLYTQRATEVLIIGPTASGKRTVAKQLIKSRDVYLSVSTAESMPRDIFLHVPHVDFILFMVDMTNKESLTTLERALQTIEPTYGYSKCAVVVSKVDSVQTWAFEFDSVKNLLTEYNDIPLFHVNLKDEPERRDVCSQITRTIRISALQQKDVDPLLLKSLEHYIIPE
ncbi:hypothetical protein VTP01DRAFT_10474 [Rhizomucor pusillus]|uniref:uncharacterized protein n=1 Tax=Rhizomucor pusillus TaxID=4840 RepID=UPI0037421D1B